MRGPVAIAIVLLTFPTLTRAELVVDALAGAIPSHEATPAGRLDLAWRFAPDWHVDLLLGAAAGIGSGAVRLSAAPGVRWTPVADGTLEPHLWAGLVHAHAMLATHLAHAPVHAVVGADGKTMHRTGAGLGAGVAWRPIETLPLRLVAKVNGFAFLPQEGLPSAQLEVVGGVGWRF